MQGPHCAPGQTGRHQARTLPSGPSSAPRFGPRSRGPSDIAIRNLFIIPTTIFLIVFNIFPLLYSLGYSFTDFRASTNAPDNFVRLDNCLVVLNPVHPDAAALHRTTEP